MFFFPNDWEKVGFHGKAGWFLDSIGVHLKPVPKENDFVRSTTMVHAQNYIVNASFENINGFSVLQGSVGQSYDIVLAVRQRDDNFGSKALNNKLSRQLSSDSDSSHESSDVGTKDKKEKKVILNT